MGYFRARHDAQRVCFFVPMKSYLHLLHFRQKSGGPLLSKPLSWSMSEWCLPLIDMGQAITTCEF
jgi:hypothetical protein